MMIYNSKEETIINLTNLKLCVKISRPIIHFVRNIYSSYNIYY
jgi:hypothetical protein